MIFKVIVSALARKFASYIAEVRNEITKAEVAAERIEAAAKAELQKLKAELHAKVASL